MNVAATIAGLRRQLRALGTAARAAHEKAYLKSDLAFHGVTQPQVRAAAAAIVRAHPDLDHDELRALVDGLYRTRYHDLRSAGVAVLEKKQALLDADDLPWLIGLVRLSAGWAHVDWLATKVVGPVIARMPRPGAVLRRWGRDDDLWVRRTALLAQHDELRAGRGDFVLFEALAAPMTGETEFFIRKAIGWVLREVSKRRPALTCGFLSRHDVSRLTFREATRHLPAGLLSGLAGRAPPPRGARRGGERGASSPGAPPVRRRAASPGRGGSRARTGPRRRR
jgi:3-methyladenine DNA glycosylase AlkD